MKSAIEPQDTHEFECVAAVDEGKRSGLYLLACLVCGREIIASRKSHKVAKDKWGELRRGDTDALHKWSKGRLNWLK